MLEKKIKIVTIGGGSSYTPEIVEGFIQKKKSGELPISDLYLVDIEEGREKLEIVGSLAKRMVDKANVDIKIHLTTDRRKALKAADFVTTQFRVGMLDARIRDERIPLKYNLLGQETIGAGGFMKAMRTIPVILDICKDMRELCPNAWLINFTNPSGIITETVFKYGGIKCIGVCNIPLNLITMCAKILNVSEETINIDFSGLNHFVFGRKIMVDGIDRTKEVVDYLINCGGESSVENISDMSFPKELMRKMEMLPADYLKYYYSREKMFEEFKEEANTIGTRGEKVKEIEKQLFELYRDKTITQKPELLNRRGGAKYSQAAVNLICSLYNDDNKIHYVNVRNNGIIKELPENVAIECTCRVNSKGATPIVKEPLDLFTKGHLCLMKAFEELAIEAGVNGDYGAAIEALTLNPLVNDGDKAELVLQDMMLANKAYLPQFQKVIDGFQKSLVKREGK